MKQSDSTEMDRLLRRYARRNAETLPGGDGQSESRQGASGGVHMDADELNAYAEGALPEGARSRYFAHLADCDACRRLVTQLTLASGVLSEEKRAAVVEPSPSKSWREWLAALFSPPVLRYAVPALALFGVIVIAVVVMRSRNSEVSVARNNKITNNSALKAPDASNSEAETPPVNMNADDQRHPNANVASSSNTAPAPQEAQPSQTPVGVATAPPSAKTVEQSQETPLASSPVDEPVQKPVVAQAGANDRKQNTFGNEDKNRDEVAVTVTPQPTPVFSVASPTAGADAGKREEQAKTKKPEKDDSERGAVMDGTGADKTASKSAANEARRARPGRKAGEPPASSVGGGIVASKSEDADVSREKERSSETRNVGGRQFRRQGSAWIDTAYNSSRSTIHVARGSEQYRALVADEPGLRTITQQLGGEVIVVWKGRAYRFY